MDAHWVSTDSIRERFSHAMSAMYQQEVPQYGALLRLVAEVNQQVLAQDPQLLQRLTQADELERISVERHGAIRVGTAAELNMLRQLFAIMGMYPVGYYDLSQAGVPVHSTAFRPVDDAALRRNPFRLFTSLLRLELIDDAALRQQASEILAARDIFTPRCRQLVALHQQQGGFSAEQAEEFVSEALETFRWHQQTTVDSSTWQALNQQHRLIADVVCFPGCHINHLTPRTLDIDRVQALMPQQGITPKAIIEGPPQRQVPILLRQTSFKALDEAVRFRDGQQGTHTARFGEIEQRGVALTRKGRELYDRLLAQAGSGGDNQQHQQHLAEVFTAFPDDETTLRQQQLAWFEYRRTAQGRDYPITPASDIEQLIAQGMLTAEPIIYEDFLPVSAAGIFQSNLGSETRARSQGHASREQFEQASGAAVHDEIELYAQREQASLRRCGLL
ncbi:putative glyoxalase superfamily metalloenzyme YdcJ [Erwinia toletana]|uniref:2-oxoadipate dioxygenase/decarboxylase n=1 Tax=Winslowiella toletana TaxID=92490 RepID=A0ABS4PFV1_9GAMM|nr:VOC family protein [Winslowiella toletana]MBP2171516.1 putative glyoxalase superfamily metalloenzyme YdcJ [Winslowiella toletana]